MRKTRHTTLSSLVGQYIPYKGDPDFLKAMEIQQKMLAPPPPPVNQALLDAKKLLETGKHWKVKKSTDIVMIDEEHFVGFERNTVLLDVGGVLTKAIANRDGSFTLDLPKFGVRDAIISMSVNQPRRKDDHCGALRGPGTRCGGLERDPDAPRVAEDWCESWRRI